MEAREYFVLSAIEDALTKGDAWAEGAAAEALETYFNWSTESQRIRKLLRYQGMGQEIMLRNPELLLVMETPPHGVIGGGASEGSS
jgi:hypothetical protein